MKGKLLSMILAVTMTAALLAGCGSSSADSAAEPAAEEAVEEAAEEEEAEAPAEETEEEAEAPAEASGDHKFALVVQGPINDGSWNTGAYNGLEAIKAAYGVEGDWSEASDASSFEEVFRNYVLLGYDVIIGHGAQFLEAAKIVAADNPDVMFIVNSNLTYQEPNLAAVNPNGDEMGLICGVAAAAASKTGKVGAIGGAYSPTTTGPLNGFAAGALSYNPDVEVTLSIIDTWDDASKAKEQALAMIDAGVDVIMSDCDSAGFGVYEACTERGVYCMPTYGSQNDVAPENVICSGLCDAGQAIKAMGDVIMEGGFEPKAFIFGVAEGCAGYEPNEAVWNALIDDAGNAAVEDITAKLANKEITVDEYVDEYVPDDIVLK